MSPRRPTLRIEGVSSANRRLNLWYGALLFIIALIILRLFYLQVVRHDYYHKAALNSQLKEYTINPERGIIKAHSGDKVVPLALNERLYTLYADPSLIKNAVSEASKLANITSGNASEYANQMQSKGTRYTVLAKRLDDQKKKQIEALKLPGVGLQSQNYRTYPQGTLAAQLLGFVNDGGKGNYGVEQALNKDLSGRPGRLKAITDAEGVPLAASRDNVEIDPKAGSDVTLTIDVSMQQQLEKILKNGLDRARSSSGSALIMDPKSGAIKAMANYPTYDPSRFYEQSDASVFNDAAVSSPLEVGSVMKTLTAAAALDQGVVKPDTTYNDPGRWQLDGSTITNIEEVSSGTHSVADILNLSINTGATWMLMQMGGGQVNQQARNRWHDYMVNHYQFGRATGIEQGYEAAGYVPNPNEGYGLNLTYANTSFGQAMTATPLQLAAALSSAVNGGTYYKPRLIDQTADSSGKTSLKKPEIVRRNVVSQNVSKELQSLMQYVVSEHLKEGFSYLNFPSNIVVGGKTGTAQIANPSGGYFTNKYNGTYVGFVGGDKPEYVIVVRVNTPGIGGYAGSQAAQPLFADLAHMLINNFNVAPKS